MTAALASEDAWVEALRRRLGADPAGVVVGVGDDAALLSPGSAAQVVTTDVLVDGVHFRLAECGAVAAVAKALAVNLSDLAAVAALPVGFLAGLVLPRTFGGDLLSQLCEGLGHAAERFGCPLLGGDTNVADGPLVIAITALGRPGPGGFLSRAGARPGDRLSVTGPLGGSLLRRHLDVVPRIGEAQVLAQSGLVHAMMDLSDGLRKDLPRLCRASGTGALVRARCVPIHEDVARFRARGPMDRSPLDHALGDGEDYELLVAHGALSSGQVQELRAKGVVLIEVGQILPAPEGLLLELEDGTFHPLGEGGHDHFHALLS